MKRRTFCHSLAGVASAAALLRCGVFGAKATARESDAKAVEDFRAVLRGRLLTPGDDSYDAARRIWNGAFDYRPALIARCVNADDVAHSIDFARKQELLVAVRSGGHSFPGYSSCDGGLVIDLSPMRTTRVDTARRTMQVDAGALLSEFDRDALAHGFVTTTGTVSGTGIAGLTLGGGFGRLARRLGLACDNLIGAHVVLADGRRVQANERENPDLFWALRGGGGNFGIVTTFEFRVHPAPAQTQGGAIVFPFEHPRALLRSLADFFDGVSDDFFVLADIVPGPDGKRLVACDVCHTGPAEMAERELRQLRAIAPAAQDSIAPMPYLQIQRRVDENYPAGRGYYLKSGYTRALSPQVLDAMVGHLEAGPGPGCIASFVRLGGAIARVPPGATAYWHRAAQYGVMLVGVWDSATDAQARQQWVKRGWQRLEPLTDGSYVNLMAADESDRRLRMSYGGNYERLAAVKKRYDPANLFSRNANILPGA